MKIIDAHIHYSPQTGPEFLTSFLDRTETDACTLFSEGDVYRVRKLERICADFELPVVGGTIIVDLLERIDQLEREVQSLQGFDAED